MNILSSFPVSSYPREAREISDRDKAKKIGYVFIYSVI